MDDFAYDGAFQRLTCATTRVKYYDNRDGAPNDEFLDGPALLNKRSDIVRKSIISTKKELYFELTTN